MKVKLIFAIALLSSQVHASCTAVAKTWDAGAQGNVTTKIYGHNEYSITNDTAVDQNYKICFEISTQMFDHSHKFTNYFCEVVRLNPGSSTGLVMRNPTVDVKYEKVSSRYYVAIDSITEIYGECESLSHDIKRLMVY